MAQKALKDYEGDRDEEWPILLSRAQAEIGKYADSQETNGDTIELSEHPASIGGLLRFHAYGAAQGSERLPG